jgi:non-ribosomal peptide synthetase component F
MNLVPVDSGVSRFDLTLTFDRRGGGLEALLEYNTSLFDEVSMAAMIQQYQQLVAAAVADPDRPLAELSLVAAGEREEVHS